MQQENKDQQEQEKMNQENGEKSLQSSDREVIEKRRPPEGSEPISDAGKKREEGRRYQ